VYDTLLWATDKGFEPGLAKAVDIVDASTVKITLRAGITFTDGTAFDAAAVKTGLLHNDDKAAPAIKAEFHNIGSIDVVDPTTLTVHLSAPVAGSWTFLLASGEGMIVSPKALADGLDLSKTAVGAGPFKVDRYDQGALLRLVKNPGYFDADRVHLDAIEFVHVADPASAVNALRSGQVQGLPAISYNQRAGIGGTGASVVPMEVTNSVATLPWNKVSICMSRPPFDDVRVRKALSLAIDRDRINQGLYGGKGIPMTGGYFPPGSPFYDAALGQYIKTDKEQAKALLAEAGYGPGNALRFEAFSTAGDGERLMEILQQDFKDVGVTMDVALTTDLFNEFLLNARRPVGGYNNQDKGIARITSGYRKGSPFNVCQYSNPELEALLQQMYAADQNTPSQEAIDLWSKIQTIVLGDYLTWSGVFVPLAYAVSDDVGGVVTWENSATYAPAPDWRYAYFKD
jgi:peptide/nickel transport system substrate-binding protein